MSKMKRSDLVEFFNKRHESLKFYGNKGSEDQFLSKEFATYIADALIKEGFVKVDEPQEHWEIYDQKVNNTLCVCFSLEEAIKYRPRYSNYETKIYHCVEVEND